MSLIICNKLENLISILEADKTLKENMEGYKTELKSIRNSLAKFTGRTANKYKENCDIFIGTASDAGKIPKFLDKLETYNEIMEELALDTSKLIDRCRYFGQTLQDNCHKTDYSDSLESGHHVFYNDNVNSIKTDCDTCIEYDADELEYVDKAESWLSGETFPDGYSNPIEGIKSTMSQYIEIQDRIDNFKFSFNAYALFSNELSKYVKDKFTAMSDSNYLNFPKPSGMGNSDSIKEQLKSNYEDVKLYSAYLQGDAGVAKLQEDCDNYDSADDAEKERIGKSLAAMFNYCVNKTNGNFDQKESQKYHDAMGIIALWTMPEAVTAGLSGKTNVRTDADKINVLLSNTSEDNEATREILKQLGKCNVETHAGTITGVTFRFDKAAISAEVSVTRDFLGIKTSDEYNVVFYTSQERSLDYIDYMQKTDPNYANHLMNDLGYSKDQLASMLTTAENHYDMEQLDNLVNANADYSNVFTTDSSKLSDKCGKSIALYSFTLMDNYDGVARSEGEFMKLSNAVLNATFNTDGLAKTRDLLDLICKGAAEYNQDCIVAYFVDNSQEVREELNLSNGVLSYWGFLGGFYENYASEWLGVYSSNESYMEFKVEPYGSFYSDETGDFQIYIYGDIAGDNVSPDNDISNKWGKPDHYTIGTFWGDEGQEKFAQDYVDGIMKEVKESQRNMAVDSAIDLVSTFNPKVGAALEFAKDLSEAKFWDAIKEGKGLSDDIISDMIDDPFVLNELEANGYNVDTISRLMDEGKIVFSVGSVVADYITDYYSEEEKIAIAVENRAKALGLDSIYSYNNGTGEVSLCTPDAIDFVREWNQEGCRCFVDNDRTYKDAVFNKYNKGSLDNELSPNAIFMLADFYGIDIKETSAMDWTDEDRQKAIDKLPYTEEQIISAFNVMLDGAQDTKGNTEIYGNVQSIPSDLCTASVYVMNTVVDENKGEDKFGKKIEKGVETFDKNENDGNN